MKKLMLLLLAVFFSGAIYCQKYLKLDPQDSDSDEDVYEIPPMGFAQDIQGNMWFANYRGLQKWDGAKWSQYKFSRLTAAGTVDYSLAKVFSDPQNNIWAVSAIMPNPTSALLHTMEGDKVKKCKLVHISDIKTDKTGKTWMYGTKNKTMAVGTMKLYSLEGNEWKEQYDTDNKVYSPNATIFFDSKNNLWIASHLKGVFMYDHVNWNNYLKDNELNFCTKKSFLNCEVYLRGYVSEYTFFEDRQGNIWLVTCNNGIFKYDHKSWTNFTDKDGLYSNHACGISEDKNGNLWITHFQGGISKYDGTKWNNYKFGGKYYKKQDAALAEFITNDFPDDWYLFPSYITIDNLDNVWCAFTGSGLFKYDGQKWDEIQPASTVNSTVSLLQDLKGNIWFGNYGGRIALSNMITLSHTTGAGLLKFDIKTNSIKHLVIDKDAEVLLPDKSGNVWCFIDKVYCYFPPE